MNENFLLTTPLAQRLYHECAEELPVIDYHNHLSVEDVIANRQFGDIAELWLLSDPYKHRAMRICGVEERLITGGASNFEKFEAWCRIFSGLVGNPLQHWSQMELARVFDIDLFLNAENARRIWDAANEKLKDQSLFARGILERFRVEYAAPCQMITDSPDKFMQLSRLAPSLRGDGILPLTKEFVERLGKSAGVAITSLDSLKAAFSKRMDEFHRAGCRFSDHDLDSGFRYDKDDGGNEKRFEKILRGEVLSEDDSARLCSHVLRMLGGEYALRGWVMQLHIGALRSTSSRLRGIAGPAGGFAGIGRCAVAEVVSFLDDLEQGAGLPRTILFTLNPADNAQLAILSGSFSEDGVAGKVQQGAAWWWCDHLGGIRGVLDSFSEFSVLSVFLGMTTDSRSPLSFVRHEYFRRVFCGWLGEKVQRGDFQSGFEDLRELVHRVCYQNVKDILVKGEV